MASGIGLGAGTVLPSDPSITRLNILKKFPGASMAIEAESPGTLGTFDKPSFPDFAPFETF